MIELFQELIGEFEPWVQFIVLYFGLMWLLNVIANEILKVLREIKIEFVQVVLFIPIMAIMFSPILFGLYFTVYHVDGWWNLLLWAYTAFAIMLNFITLEGK